MEDVTKARQVEVIRELFIEFVMLIITVAATAWLNDGPRQPAETVPAIIK